MKKKSTDYFGKGLIISLLLMVIDLIGGFAHLRFETWFRWISTILMIILLIYFCIQYGKTQTDGVTFGKVFGYGFKIALVVSILMVIYTMISVYLIFPEFVDQVLLKTRTDLEAKGGLSEEQIDQGVNHDKEIYATHSHCTDYVFSHAFFRYNRIFTGRCFYEERRTGSDYFSGQSVRVVNIIYAPDI